MSLRTNRTLNSFHPQKLRALRMPKKQSLFVIHRSKDFSSQLVAETDTVCFDQADLYQVPDKELMAIVKSCQAILVQWPMPNILPVLETIKRKIFYRPPLLAVSEPSQEAYASAVAAGFDAVINSPSDVNAVTPAIRISNQICVTHEPDEKLSIREAAYASTESDYSRPKSKIYAFGALLINEQEHLLFADGEVIHLTSAEFEIMRMLVKNAGVVQAYSELLKVCRDISFDPTSNTVAVHICNIKRKLRPKGMHNYIINVYGVGYRIELPS